MGQSERSRPIAAAPVGENEEHPFCRCFWESVTAAAVLKKRPPLFCSVEASRAGATAHRFSIQWFGDG